MAQAMKFHSVSLGGRCGAARSKTSCWIIGPDRHDQQSRGDGDYDCEGPRLELAVQRKADQLDGMRERIQGADPRKRRTCFLHAPKRIECAREKKSREDHEVHDA